MRYDFLISFVNAIKFVFNGFYCFHVPYSEGYFPIDNKLLVFFSS